MKNKITLLKEYHPYLSELDFQKTSLKNIIIENTKINSPTLKIILNNKTFYLHSKYDPIKEANNQVNSFSASSDDIIIVLGVGLGYHIKELRKKFPKNFVVICEYNPDIFKFFIEYIDEKFLKDEKLIFLVSSEKIYSIDSILRYLIYLKIKKQVKIRILRHIPSFNICPQYKEIENEILNRITEIYSDFLTTREFKDLWTRNIKLNLNLFDSSYKLNELKQKYLNKPMAIISAGPSLENHLEFLKQNKITTVCVDTALRFLIKNNFYPDYVISLDAKYENLYDFKYLNFNKTKLIYDIVVFPKIPRLFKERYVTYTLKLIKTPDSKYIEYYDEPVRQVIEKYGDFGGLQSGGSVSTNALDFALFTGANPVYFVGLDLCNVNFKSHCRATFREFYFLQRINKFYNLDSLEFLSIMKRKTKTCIKNENIITEEFILNKYKKWFLDAFNLISPKIQIKILSPFF